MEPLLFLPLAALFLKENVDKPRWVCALIGFVGILLMTYQDFQTLNVWIFVPFLATFLFAISNLIVKKMVYEEPLSALLFYFGFITSVLFFIPALLVWVPLSLKQWGLLILLGINGNLIQIFIFKAFALSDVSALMPLRYTEFIFTFLAGWLLFHQIPDLTLWIGGLITVGSSLALTFFEKKKESR
jgi:S-adenosylmethionine uptake transporter